MGQDVNFTVKSIWTDWMAWEYSQNKNSSS